MAQLIVVLIAVMLLQESMFGSPNSRFESCTNFLMAHAQPLHVAQGHWHANVSTHAWCAEEQTNAYSENECILKVKSRPIFTCRSNFMMRWQLWAGTYMAS